MQKDLFRHIMLKLSKVNVKERVVKAARKKRMVTYKGTPIRLSADFSAETPQDRMEWNGTLKILKLIKLSAKNTPSRKVILHIWRRNKGFPRQKLREFITTRPALQAMLKGALLPETKTAKVHKTLSKVM